MRFHFLISTCSRDWRFFQSTQTNSTKTAIVSNSETWIELEQFKDRDLAWWEENPRDASASSDHYHGHHVLLAVRVSCCGGTTHYETPWHGVIEGFRLCWPLWGPSSPSVSWPSPSAPTTGFTPGRTSATPLMPPRTTPRCKPKKSKATWRTPGCGGSAVLKVK